MAVHAVLDRLEEIFRRLLDSAFSQAHPDAAAILRMRQDFALEYGNFLKALSEDVDVIGNRGLLEDLQQEMEILRSKLTSYQFQWQPAQMKADPQGYSRAAHAVATMVETFISDTRNKLVSAGI